jgi:hypothetical protein
VSARTNATIHECGNGFPDAGDYVAGDDGELYRVVELVGPIHTGPRQGAANYVYAVLEQADWSDTEADNLHESRAIVGEPP